MLKNVTIVGGGVLGTQIGLMAAYTGHEVTFWLRSEGSIGRTRPKIELYSKMMLEDLEKSKALIGNPMGAYVYPRGLIRDWKSVTAEKIDELEAGARDAFANHVHITLDLAEALKDADIVIEAMAEDPKQKTEMFKKMAGLLPEKTILCTNSSTLLPSQFAEYTGRPEKFLALHFANTIWKNNTAEVMGHPGTDPEIYKKVVAFADEINMVPLQLHKEQPGYILNSMLVPFLDAAMMLWAKEVADPQTIDLTWKLATSAPAGPFQILDIVGVQTAYNIAIMNPKASDPNSVEAKIVSKLKEMIDKGETGINAGKGFYDYSKK
ncbi:MAG: 3-hydroxyacyl-CoA dehydrogenase [Oscillospiraceae bacterium]